MTSVLLLCPNMIPSVILCGHTQLEWLAERGLIKYKWSRSKDVTAELASWADIVVFVRSDSAFEVMLAEKIRNAGKAMVYVLDDDLLNVPDYITSADYYQSEDVKKSIGTLLSDCDFLLAPSPRLLSNYGKPGKSALVEEPSVSNAVLTKKSQSDSVKIGFAGSIDRSKDIDDLLAGTIGLLLKRYGERITIEFFGAKPKLVEKYNLRHIPYCDSYENYLSVMETLHWDIGLAPMPDTHFHASKHYNKFIEYMGYGISGVYSAVEPYTRIIRDGENGLLCSNSKEEWFAALCRLIDDSSLREEIAANCLIEARERFSIEATALQLWDNLKGLARPESERKKVADFRIMENANWIWRYKSAIRRHGLRLPLVVLKKLKEKLF